MSAVKGIFDAGLFRGEVRYDEPMSGHTSLRIGGTIRIMAFPEDPLSLRNIIHAAEAEGSRLIIVGAGTNILFPDGTIEAIAVSLREFNKIEPARSAGEDKIALFVNSGVQLARLINFTREKGYSGLEALAGIPGSFGGAVAMNAGSFGTEIKDVVESVAVMNRKGDINIMDKSKLNFGYRTLDIAPGDIILSANIVLTEDDPGAVAARIRKFFDMKRSSQPLGERSAGCVFKNPEGDSAGRLIDAAGCKGMRIGDAEVSTVHANYFINRGKASYADFIALIHEVRTRVSEHSGILLEPEIRIIKSNEKQDTRQGLD